MISKELLSIILGVTIYGIKPVNKTNSIKYIFDCIGEKRDGSINIYEVTHMCKEWAFNTKDCMFDIRYHTNSSDRHLSIMTYGSNSQFFCGVTEYEVVFQLCEWLLQKDNK